ncbi:hypothetical protein CPB83DRAFT_766639 [Crepidotus variabilis]|uniref:Uncharacterized protein n=1 Tax=Crepidotus variabilis TaxID=179855 RepID=A0A9P6JPH3_9AGAR|nr:hypothetical protein CPB83DRAFT_766639 [Crepidotus variabilis]
MGGQHAQQMAAYIRIAAISVATYDFLITQPTAWRFYREHWQTRRLNISIVLFVAIRYTSICVLTLSTVGFFYEKFTPTSCFHFHLIPPIFKVIQAMVSQAILGIRVFNLSRRSKRVGYFLLATYCIACSLQWVTTIYGRKRYCKAADDSHRLGAYIFYVIAIGYDVLTTALSMWFLQRYKNHFKNTV